MIWVGSALGNVTVIRYTGKRYNPASICLAFALKLASRLVEAARASHPPFKEVK